MTIPLRGTELSLSKEYMLIPYLPQGRSLKYVSDDNAFLVVAKNIAIKSSPQFQQTGAVIVRDGIILGSGNNQSWLHRFACLRRIFRIKTGKHYWLCSGCHPKHHAERRAIKDAFKKHTDIHDADLYLWGHWWCCRHCWEVMISAGIRNVYLAESEKNKPRKK